MAVIKINDKFVDNFDLGDTYDSVIQYCTKPDKTVRGYIRGHNVGTKNPAFEMQVISRLHGHDSGRRLRHSILSFADKEHVSPAEADKIAAEIMEANCYNGHQMLSAVHEDTDDVHIHFVMNVTNFDDGSKFSSAKRAFYAEQNSIKQVLNKHGIPILEAKKW